MYAINFLKPEHFQEMFEGNVCEELLRSPRCGTETDTDEIYRKWGYSLSESSSSKS